jgi:FKBP-type peptidyl-prolyl cis-trans isomerase
MWRAGLIYKDFKVGSGPQPVNSQLVTFAYSAYNESGGFIDSTYRKGKEAVTQLGIKGLIPGPRN